MGIFWLIERWAFLEFKVYIPAAQSSGYFLPEALFLFKKWYKLSVAIKKQHNQFSANENGWSLAEMQGFFIV